MTGVNPTVTLPLGTFTITLVVNDGQVDSAPDTVDITVAVRVEGLQSPQATLVPQGDLCLPKIPSSLLNLAIRLISLHTPPT